MSFNQSYVYSLNNGNSELILGKTLTNIIILNDDLLRMAIDYNNKKDNNLINKINIFKADILINVKSLQYQLESGEISENNIKAILNIFNAQKNRLFEVKPFFNDLKEYALINIYDQKLKDKIFKFVDEYEEKYYLYEDTTKKRIAPIILVGAIIAVGTMVTGCGDSENNSGDQSSPDVPITVDEDGPLGDKIDQNNLLKDVMNELENQDNND